MKRVFSILLCVALAVSLFAIPAFADEGEVVSNVGLLNNITFKTGTGKYTDVTSGDGAFSGTMTAEKNEIEVKFDNVDLSSYADTGYIGFKMKLSVVPAAVRTYINGTLTVNKKEHKGKSTVSAVLAPNYQTDANTADKWVNVYIPLSLYANAQITCYSGKDDDHTASGSHKVDFKYDNIYQLNIQPEVAANTKIEVKDFAIYNSSALTINGNAMTNYWRPMIDGNVIIGNAFSNNKTYGQTGTIDKNNKYNDKDFMASQLTIDPTVGYATIKANTTNTNGAAVNVSMSSAANSWYSNYKISLPESNDKYILRLKVKSQTVPTNLLIGPKSGTANAGGIRPVTAKYLETWNANEWSIIEIPMDDFLKGGMTNATAIDSISLMFVNINGNALSDIDIADIAIYGPKRGLTVTGLKVTKSDEETATYSANDSLVIAADAANTSASSKTFKAVGAFYNGETLSQVTLLDMSAAAATSATVKSAAITAPEGTTSFKAFAFTSMSDITPLCEAAQATAE